MPPGWETSLIAWVTGIGAAVVAVVAAVHVILNKRDSRAAAGWVGLILLSPLFGAFAYYLLGINRIHRRAVRKTGGRGAAPQSNEDDRDDPGADYPIQLRRLARMNGATTGFPLTHGNRIEPLVEGDVAYPAMLEAIAAAERSILLQSYIFDDDPSGREFAAALLEARDRGVEVRVLVDGVGVRYSRPPITRRLRDGGLPVREFLPSRLPFPSPYTNLRNHRKILVIDREVGFTGGMNIREACRLSRHPRSPVRDIHFRIEGPVVQHLWAAAAEDWTFASEERLTGSAWAGPARVIRPGRTAARGILDGPDEHFETITWSILAALDAARTTVRVVTPYFLPDVQLVTALRLAALRGVDVEILIPEKNNLRIVQWASTAHLHDVLQPGCTVRLTRPPFDHSKIMTVDGAWSLIGSANWDARSLRLNFEFGIESWDRDLAARLDAIVAAKREASRTIGLEDVEGRGIPTRLRDGIARLASPYL